MRTRGRPPKHAGPRRYPNRLLELRRRLGLSQQGVAERAGISLAYYGALERGDKRINADTARRLEEALHCSAGDLLTGTPVRRVPLLYAVAASESEGRPASFELPEPHEWLQPGRLADAESCFAAEIVDSSADLDFPRGTVLFVRPLPVLQAPLRVGTRVLARFYLETEGAEGKRLTQEILYGILDRNIVGDLVLITRTGNRLVPRHALIRRAAGPSSGLAERAHSPLRRDDAIEYAPAPGDPGEILGVVVYAAGPA